MGKKSKSTSNTVQTQSTALNPGLQSLSDSILGQVQGAGKTDYSAITSGAHSLAGMANDQLSGKYLNAESNPYIGGVADAYTANARKALDSAIVGIGDASQQAGAYGGSRQGVREGTAIGDFTDSVLSKNADLYYQNYVNERENQIGSGQQLAQALALLSGAGTAGALDQTQILQALAPYNSTTTGTSDSKGTQTMSGISALSQLAQVAGLFAPKG